MSYTVRLSALVVCSVFAGCVDVEPPEGRLVCATSAECPADWVCRADQRCYRTADVDASTVDAGVDGSTADARVDGSRVDEGVPPLDEGIPPVDEGVPPLDEGVPLDMNLGVDAGGCVMGTLRPCASGSDVGECAVGIETCNAFGGWEACIGAQGPSAETCNGNDDDCNGAIDNDVPAGMACTAGIGACARPGTLSCVAGSYSSCSALAGMPTAEMCNGIDDDCDAAIDDGPIVRSCYTGAAGTSGVGECRTGTQTCAGGVFPAACVGQILPSAETCNGRDDDCDNVSDDRNPGGGGACTSGVGACFANRYSQLHGWCARLQCDARHARGRDLQQRRR